MSTEDVKRKRCIFGPILAASGLVLSAQSAMPERASEDPDLTPLQDLLNTRILVSSMSPVSMLFSPSSVSVIDREILLRYNIQTVEEALSLVSGMDVWRTYQKRSIVTARGIVQEQYSTKVLLLVDGVPTWMASTGEGEPYRISPEDLERIEVLKGPASVLYGSNAYVGAVNLVLRKQPALAAYAGKYSRSGSLGGGRIAGRTGGLDYFFSANINRMEGHAADFAAEDGTRVLATFWNATNATARLGWGAHNLLINVVDGQEGGQGDKPRWDSGLAHEQQVKGQLVNYTFATTLGRVWELEAGATFDANTRDYSLNANDTLRSHVEGDRKSAFLKVNRDPTSTLSWEFGLEYENRTSRAYSAPYLDAGVVRPFDSNLRDRSVSEKSAYLQGRYHLSRFSLLVGSRYTRNELAGSNVSSRATAVFLIDERQSLKFIAGQSFRAPTLFEFYFGIPYQGGSFWIGNPRLKPEKATTFEVAYLAAFRNVFLQALVYRGSYEDKIFRVIKAPFVEYANGQVFHSTGLELDLRFRSSLATGFVNLDYLLTTDHGDELPGTDHYNFKYVPRYNVSAGLSKRTGPWLLSAKWRYMDRMGSTFGEIGGQGKVDLSLAYVHETTCGSIQHAVSVKNAGDRELWLPEYARRRNNCNAFPMDGLGRLVSYSLKVSF